MLRRYICILIINCWSSGEIQNINAGGIAGRDFGTNGGEDT